MTPHRLNKPDFTFSKEEQLWKSFKEGDLKAYEKLYNLYYQDLYGYGLKLCSRKDLVRDSIQALFITIWDRKDHLDEVRSVKAYLLASLRRKILRTLKEERNRFSPEPEHEENYDTVQISIEESIIQNELEEFQIEALREALESLPERQKEILFLKYYNGMSYEEIEDILSINYQSIRNHICRAIKKLRTRLKDEVLTSLFPLLILFLPLLYLAF
ncbi:MAG: sigma-70 family RNA polymerase sigma factor [Balneolaceae bacterium]|nr:sigma-70 family RNA polymerase sigma factor [Balneolaceae bacterium]